MLSSVALPGLNGFVGEYLILLGTFQASSAIAVVAVSGVVFGAVYLLMATRKMLFGPVTNAANKGLPDLGAREIGLMLPVVALCVWIGVAPNMFMDPMKGSLADLDQRLVRARSEAKSVQLELERRAPTGLVAQEEAR